MQECSITALLSSGQLLAPGVYQRVQCLPAASLCLQVSFAADNNFGDVSAKATSQTIFSSVVGTSAGEGEEMLRAGGR